jgi:hypothetical protein
VVSDVRGVPVEAPALTSAVTFDQHWCDLTFLHWPVEPDRVAHLIPPGAQVDVFDGLTYVGLVPFAMRDVRLGTALRAPYLGAFGEVNVRLYSVDDKGRHGVVFRSLDCSRLAVVLATRAVAVPYVWAHVSTTGGPGPVRSYAVRRRGRGPVAGAHCAVSVRAGRLVEPTERERWLTARWGMHGALLGRPLWIPNHHGDWPLHEATIERLDDGLVAAAGVTPTGPMLRPLWSPGVHARFGVPELG